MTEELVQAVDEFLSAYSQMYRRQKGGLNEGRLFKAEVANLWVAYNDHLTSHLRENDQPTNVKPMKDIQS